jgi:hypothetical protein
MDVNPRVNLQSDADQRHEYDQSGQLEYLQWGQLYSLGGISRRVSHSGRRINWRIAINKTNVSRDGQVTSNCRKGFEQGRIVHIWNDDTSTLVFYFHFSYTSLLPVLPILPYAPSIGLCVHNAQKIG